MFLRISSGGVTTSLILPGFLSPMIMLNVCRSANNIGGEAYVLKSRKVPTLSVEDMLIQYNITTKHERWSKPPLKLFLIFSQNGLWRESKVSPTISVLMNRRVYGNAVNWPGGPNSTASLVDNCS